MGFLQTLFLVLSSQTYAPMRKDTAAAQIKELMHDAPQARPADLPEESPANPAVAARLRLLHQAQVEQAERSEAQAEQRLLPQSREDFNPKGDDWVFGESPWTFLVFGLFSAGMTYVTGALLEPKGFVEHLPALFFALGAIILFNMALTVRQFAVTKTGLKVRRLFRRALDLPFEAEPSLLLTIKNVPGGHVEQPSHTVGLVDSRSTSHELSPLRQIITFEEVKRLVSLFPPERRLIINEYER